MEAFHVVQDKVAYLFARGVNIYNDALYNMLKEFYLQGVEIGTLCNEISCSGDPMNCTL